MLQVLLGALIGAVLSFVGSIYANYLFIDKPIKQLRTQRAYEKLVNKLIRLDSLPSPSEMLPLEIADRVADLRMALTHQNEAFNFDTLLEQAFEQAAKLRKEWDQRRAVSK